MKVCAVLIGGVCALAVSRCAALPACAEVTVRASVEIAQGTFSLADLLVGVTCREMREAAAQVRLGVAPRAGSVRVFDGQQVRGLITALASSKSGDAESGVNAAMTMRIPERVEVRPADVVKTCAQIAASLARAAGSRDSAGGRGKWQRHLDCAAARHVPGEAQLELVRTNWNQALQRWEFSVRCVRPEACVPFMVWAQEETPNSEGVHPEVHLPAPLNHRPLLVKPGQTATLMWEQGGIRVVLPVTCLEAGGLGEVVRVRLKNVPRTLRAEVMSDGTLQVRL
jgi:hypothetical protein